MTHVIAHRHTRRATRWRPLIAALAAALLPGLVWANWAKVGESELATLYMDRSSIQREENVVRVWEIQDLKVADGDGVRSRRYLNEYDCTYKMHRLGQMTSYAGPKLTGEKIANVKEMGYWRKIPPNGVFVLTYIAVCVE